MSHPPLIEDTENDVWYIIFIIFISKLLKNSVCIGICCFSYLLL